MSLRDRLAEQLARYDDEAFAALANAGLLRRARKDLAAATPAIVEASQSGLVVALGAVSIRFDERGPAHARCSCPASGPCQHRIAAALWLKDALAAAPPEVAAAAATSPIASDDPPAAADDPLAPLHALLMGFDAAALTRHAGTSGFRWAAAFVEDLDPERGFVIGGERYLVLGFTRPALEFRFLGGGLGELIADRAIAAVEKYRVAAVLAYQRAFGAIPPAPPPRTRATALDLGKDHALPEDAGDALAESRRRLRSAVAVLLVECIELGLSHLSATVQERFQTLATWAQGAEYHRLALLLRRLGDHVEQLLERAGSADEHRLLDEMTIAYGLVGALEQTASLGAAPRHLVGRARHRYETVAALELIGLGALPWRSASGYVGLTMLFWSPRDAAFLTCTDARPAQQRGFDPAARYRVAGPWEGLSSPAHATGRRLTLDAPQVSAQGRLSSAAGIPARVDPALPTFAELASALRPCDSWPELERRLDAARQSLLAEPAPLLDWVVLRPSRVAEASFVESRQVLVCPLLDAEQRVLPLELAYSEHNRPAIERLEQGRMTRGGVPPWVVARIRRGGGEWVAEPLSLIHPDAAPGRVVDALYFDPAPTVGLVDRALAGLRRRVVAPVVVSPRSHSHPRIDALHHFLTRQAERGISPASAESVGATLRRLATELRGIGYSAFAGEHERVAVALLRANYLRLQYARAAGEEVAAEADGSEAEGGGD